MASPGEFAVSVQSLGGGGNIVRVSGELDMATSSELEAALERVHAAGQVVIDLTECEFFDSSAVRVVLTGASRVEAAGGSVAIVAPHPRIRRVLEIAGVDSRLPIHATLESAS